MKTIPVLDKDVQFVIPTHGRPTSKDQKTWHGLPPEIRTKTLLLTSTKTDAKALRNALDYEHVYCVRDPVAASAISKKRQWIIENIKARYIFQLDDDLTFQRRCPKKMRFFDEAKGWKMLPKYKDVNFIEIKTLTDKQKLRSWEFFLERILSKGIVHGGLAARMGNNRLPEEYKSNTRVMQAMFHHRNTLLKRGIRFDKVQFREDFHVTMSLLKLGYPNLVNLKFIVNADPFGKKGGCSNERTVEASNRDAVRIAKLHDPFIKAVERKYSHSTPRTEVVCYWQKGYQSAKKKERYVK